MMTWVASSFQAVTRSAASPLALVSDNADSVLAGSMGWKKLIVKKASSNKF